MFLFFSSNGSARFHLTSFTLSSPCRPPDDILPKRAVPLKFAGNKMSRGMGHKCIRNAIAKHVRIVWLDKRHRRRLRHDDTFKKAVIYSQKIQACFAVIGVRPLLVLLQANSSPARVYASINYQKTKETEILLRISRGLNSENRNVQDKDLTSI